MSHGMKYAEMHSQAPEKSKAFYGQLFGWKFPQAKDSPIAYSEIEGGDGIPGGMLESMVPSGHSAWVVYVTVDDLPRSTQQAKDLGAKPVAELVEIPEGSFSLLVDPAGAMFGLFRPKR